MITRRPEKTMLESLPIRLITTRITPVILVLLCVTLVIAHRLESAPVEKLRTMVTDAAAPVLYAVSKPVSDFVSSFDGVATMRSLKAENIRLKEENAKLKEWYETALRLQAENQSFRDLLNVRADPELSFVTARVVSDPGGAFIKSVLLPVGAKDGLRKGGAVMSSEGLIGRVTEVGVRSSRVLLVTDLNSRIPVTIQNTRTKAILAGKNDDLMRLEHLPVDSGLTVGQRIVTSGDGGQLQPGIPVGEIAEISGDGVWVRPLGDIGGVSHVQVISTVEDAGLATGMITPAAQDSGAAALVE